ncbi:MAG: hypothetical protein BMS9Abin25_0720 [Gammaproteobacteria bacterium]|nr:MAG: hypothetical protein BMS9Abin25_0720 [Gammaproteobacteria bacterium]
MRKNSIHLLFILLLSLSLLSQTAFAENPFQQFMGGFKKFGNKLTKQLPTKVTISDAQLRKYVLGVWEGSVNVLGASPYLIVVYMYDLTEGELVGTSYYPTFQCTGTLFLKKRDQNESVYSEQIITGKRKACRDKIITGKLTKPDTAKLVLKTPGSNWSATAILTKISGLSMDKLGEIKKAANLRTGPSTQNKVLGVIPKGSIVKIIAEQGNWYMLETDTQGAAGGGWVYSSLISLNNPSTAQLALAGIKQPSSPYYNSRKQNIKTTTDSNIDYAGYSKRFIPAKQLYMDGKLEELASFYESKIQAGKNNEDNSKALKKLGVLQWLEQGTLDIDRGDFSKAVDDFSSAEKMLEKRKNASKLSVGLKKTSGWILGTVLGSEEISAYKGEGWERVLMLNYKSIAYLLQGKRRAYNVTRRSIDWQNIEKKKFDKKLQQQNEKAKEEYEKEEKNNSEQANIVRKGLMAAFAPMKAKASTVPSAYVNPFGFYVSGMIQEFESYNDRSLRDNAKISYKKALELNPKSKVLKQAVKDLAKPVAPAGTRLVQVVVADGFVPEKKVLSYNVRMGNSIIPLKMPIYEPVKSKVYRIEVRSSSGKRLAILSPVADIEAISLRQQLDMQPFLTVRAMTSFLIAATTDSVAKESRGFGGVILKTISEIRKVTSAPDTRSWMSLPATIQAARLHLRKGINKLEIRTYGKDGKKLSSEMVKIDPNSHNFVYARSIDNRLYTQSSERLWLAGI